MNAKISLGERPTSDFPDEVIPTPHLTLASPYGRFGTALVGLAWETAHDP